ncbi:MAG TPA: protein-L-isoaspartate(D-aspartate) O-methyltransferase [Leucothrix mucor]|nr:protein-L-isoaspartate(D-aspartate) O-methyltransferase [Leucothrix mucor]
MRELDVQGIGMTSQRTRDRLIDKIEKLGIKDQNVLRTMRLVPRHLFMDGALSSRSYENTSLPIGHGQTISQPYIVARMTELLLEGGGELENVLEVGTGSAYQAAVLGGLVKNLHTVERILPLYRTARDLLYALGYRNVRVHHADGTWGWQEAAPYDAIMVTAAPDEIPESLIEQLKIGGRMVIPVGKKNGEQILKLLIRISETEHNIENHESVVFVPFLQK